MIVNDMFCVFIYVAGINYTKLARQKSNGDIVYEYTWGNNPKRLEMKGRKCVLLKSLKMGSAIIQFIDNGQIEVTSTRALRNIARQAKTFKGDFNMKCS